MSTLTDALDHAHHGRRVIWLGTNPTHAGVDANEAIHLAEERYREGPEKVVRANGRQSISFPSGGSIHFTSVQARNGLRGTYCDVIYLPHWSYTQDEDFMTNVIAQTLARTDDPRVGVVA